MKYFLKRCGFQELGSVGEDGKAKRGRYLMSSQHEEVMNLFPSLSIEIPNDTTILPVVPLYTGKKTYCSYVYHNSKYTGTNAKHPRNEYRIYLNNEIENNRLLFCAEDIVVMRKCNIPSPDMSGGEEFFYYLDLIQDHYSEIYLKVNRMIEDYPIRGGYGVFEGELDFFESKVKAYENADASREVKIDKSVIDRIGKSTEETQKNIFNVATFRDFVLAGYGNACAVTGRAANSYSGDGIDVVYIRPRADGGSCMPDNGIALSKEYSLAFIQGKFTLTNSFEIEIHPEANDDVLAQYQHKQIRVPPNKFFQPSLENLKYHRERIYGSFLK